MDEIDFGPATAAELRRLQLARLKATLAHAYAGSTFYRAHFDRHGLHPGDMRNLQDLARFPFTTKSHLRDTYPFGMFATPLDRVARVHASSGTTGKPTVVGYTAEDVRHWSALVARSLRAAGVRPGMMVHVAYGYGLFTGGLGAHYGAEALGCTVVPMSVGQTERQVQMIADLKPDAIMVTPSYMLALLDEFRRQSLDPRACSLKYGVFGAEPWTEAMRREIETSFNLCASDIYGLSEVMGPGVAQEYAGEGLLTIWEDHFYPEIVHPETGETLSEGEEGELVLTSLTKSALPVIRYRTRDLTRLLPGGQTPMRRMAKVGRRVDDMLIVRGVNLFPAQVEEHVLEQPALSPHFLIEIARPARLDLVTLFVEARPGADDDTCATQARDLARRLKDLVGISVKVELRPPNSLDRSAGKAVRVRDLRRS